jgi:hypothetical protein
MPDRARTRHRSAARRRAWWPTVTRTLALALGLPLAAGCGSDAPDQATATGGQPVDAGRAGASGAPDAPAPTPIKVEPRVLPLAGPAGVPDAEISSLCWCGDHLVLVPQHPERLTDASGELHLYTLHLQEILDVLDNRRAEPLRPRPLRLEAPGLIGSLPGWDGLEALAAAGDTLFLAVETRLEGRMGGVLLRGVLEDAPPAPGDTTGEIRHRIRIDTARVAPIPLPTNLPEMSQEALVLLPGRVAVLFEANGREVNPGAHAALFDTGLEYRGIAPLEHVEYRITDATAADAEGRFWVVNYSFPAEERLLRPPAPTGKPLEQLLELQLRDGRIVRTGRAPLDLRRDPDLPARNWEAVVRLPGRGFLVMTDRYPGTLLAFVPDPALNVRLEDR